LIELAVIEAGATDEEVDTASDVLGLPVLSSGFGLRLLTTTSHRISSLSSLVSLHTTSTSYWPVEAPWELRFEASTPISPSSDSPVDASADDVLIAREREDEGVSIGAGPPNEATVAVVEELACGDSLDRLRLDGLRDNHSAVMAGRGEATVIGFSRANAGVSRLRGIGLRGGDNAVG